MHDPVLVRALAGDLRLSGADVPTELDGVDDVSDAVLGVLAEIDGFYDAWPMFLEGVEHDRARAALGDVLGPDRTEVLAERSRAAAVRCAAAIGPDGGDLYTEFVRPYVVGVVGAILEVDDDVCARVVGPSTVLGAFLFGRQDRPVTGRELAAVVRAARSVEETTARELRGPMWDRVRAHGLSDGEVAALVAQVVTGTLEPLGTQIALRLVGRVEGVAGDDLVPFRLVTRTATDRLVVGDREVGTGDVVHLYLDGPWSHRLRYGSGRHRCAGVGVAEQACRAASAAVSDRLRVLGLVPGTVTGRRTDDVFQVTGLSLSPSSERPSREPGAERNELH